MFDIEITVPVSNSSKYGHRLKDFKLYGLLNIDGPVLLNLLVGNEVIPNIEIGWPTNVVVRVIRSKYDYPACKIYDYYSNMTIEDAENARWFAKFDDDSITDVGGLVKNLDLEFDYQRDYYVVTELCKDKHKPEIDLLNRMGYSRWVDNKAKILIHEWEGNAASQSTMFKILDNPKAMDFLRKRSEIHSGAGDIALAVAARMCKVYPAECNFMSRLALLHRLSVFGGDLNHIHFISNDKNAKQFDLFKRMLKTGPKTELHNKICNRDYAYCREDQLISMVRLNSNGMLEKIDNDNERFWELEDNEIRFLTADCRVSSVFYLSDNFDRIDGRYMFEDNVRHILRALL